MPLPDDPKTIELANAVLAAFKTVFGKHPGFRPAHAKGVILSGTFTPTSEAASLSCAAHFQKETAVLVRFSNSTGIPVIPDGDPNASPRGMGIRFVLGERKHTDLIGHSTPFFPTSTGEEFLNFLNALITGAAEKYIPTHPKVAAFVGAPKPTPSSFARETYYGVNAFKLVGKDGSATVVRFRFVPVMGNEAASEGQLGLGPDFLFQEIKDRVVELTGRASFKLVAQVAGEGDVTNDATVHWPEERKTVELGTITVESVLEDSDAQQKKLIFDPIPRVEGVEPSDDPLLEFRATLYLISGRERRAA